MKRKKIRKLKATLLLALVLTANSKKAYASDDNILDSTIYNVGEPVFADDLYSKLNNLPSGVKEYLRVNNLKIVLLDDSNGAEECWQNATGYYYGPIRGFTDSSSGITIYVEASMHPGYYETYSYASNGLTVEEFNNKIAQGTLFHELGHFFDSAAGFLLSDSAYFNKIFNEEVYSYCETTQYIVDNTGIYANVSTPVEYFASAYACYVCYPESLKTNCPRTYEYIDSYMKNINEQYTPKEEITSVEETINIDDSEDLNEISEPQSKYIYIDNPEPGKPKLLVKTLIQTKVHN